MDGFMFVLSLVPIVISIALLLYFVTHHTANLVTITIVVIMTLVGTAFAIFMKFYLSWASDVNLSDIIASSIGILAIPFVLSISTSAKGIRFSIRNILPAIKRFNFPTKALLLYVGAMNLIVFITYVVCCK